MQCLSDSLPPDTTENRFDSRIWFSSKTERPPDRSPAGYGSRQNNCGHQFLNGFDSRIWFSSKTERPPDGWSFCFGAGYGSRTRLHGLGSRCITDIRILHWSHYTRDGTEIQPFFVICRRHFPLCRSSVRQFFPRQKYIDIF